MEESLAERASSEEAIAVMAETLLPPRDLAKIHQSKDAEDASNTRRSVMIKIHARVVSRTEKKCVSSLAESV